MSNGPEEQVLKRLVEEARREPPEVDWGAVETTLMARLGEAPRFLEPSPRASRSPLVLAFALAALAGAAAAAVAIVHPRAPEPAESVAEEAPETPSTSLRGHGTLNGDSLAIGAEVVASDGDAVNVDHPGHATWTLEPGSTAHIEELGSVVGVALDRGALAASVVKSARPESFVVRVNRARVAVHGTRFRVVRLAHSVRVEVSEGVVGVGPVGGSSFDVAAPASATVTLEGLRTDQRRASRDVPARSSERRHVDPGEPPAILAEAEEPEAVAPAPEPAPVPEAPAPAVQRAAPAPSINRVVEAVRRCFREETVARGDVHISVSTQMTLRIQGDGHVGEAVFTPPLAPGVQACVDASVGPLKFPSSVDGFAIDRVLELER